MQWLTVLEQVGAGPVGLTAALALAKNGVTLRIIEKQSTVAIGQRGAGLAVCHRLAIFAACSCSVSAAEPGGIQAAWRAR